MSPTPDKNPKPTPNAKTAKPKRNYRRLAWRIGIIILVAVVALRLALTLLMPPLMSKVASYYQLDCRYNRMQLSLLGGDMSIYGLRLTPRGGGGSGEPLLAAEYVQASIAPWEVLRGRLVVYRLEADGLESLVERTPDGRIPLLEHFVTPQPSEKATVTAGTSTSDVDFTSPLRVDAFRLQHVRARFRDARVVPTVETAVSLDVRVSDLGVQGRPARFEINVSAENLLDSLSITGQANGQGRNLDATLQFRMWGLHPRPTGGYLSDFGLRVKPGVGRCGAALRRPSDDQTDRPGPPGPQRES
jgi:hypothetical protein